MHKKALYILFNCALLLSLHSLSYGLERSLKTATPNKTIQSPIKTHRTLSEDDHKTENKAQRYFSKTVQTVLQEDTLISNQQQQDKKTIIAYINKYHPQIGSKDSQTIAAELVAQSKTHHVDPKFIAAIIGAESGFNKNASSRCGAKGLGQLMGSTYGTFNVKNPFDIKENISATIQYCNRLFKLFENKSLPLSFSLAAYLRGDQAIQKSNGNFSPYTIKYIQSVFKKYQTLCLLQEQPET